MCLDRGGLYSGVTTWGIAAGARKGARNQPEVEGARLFSTLILIPARPKYKYIRDKLTFTLHINQYWALCMILKIIAQLIHELTHELVQELVQELIQELMNELMNELMHELMQELIQELVSVPCKHTRNMQMSIYIWK